MIPKEKSQIYLKMRKKFAINAKCATTFGTDFNSENMFLTKNDNDHDDNIKKKWFDSQILRIVLVSIDLTKKLDYQHSFRDSDLIQFAFVPMTFCTPMNKKHHDC